MLVLPGSFTSDGREGGGCACATVEGEGVCLCLSACAVWKLVTQPSSQKGTKGSNVRNREAEVCGMHHTHQTKVKETLLQGGVMRLILMHP